MKILEELVVLRAELLINERKKQTLRQSAFLPSSKKRSDKLKRTFSLMKSHYKSDVVKLSFLHLKSRDDFLLDREVPGKPFKSARKLLCNIMWQLVSSLISSALLFKLTQDLTKALLITATLHKQAALHG